MVVIINPKQRRKMLLMIPHMMNVRPRPNTAGQ
jgi:hypothetical protein